MTAAGAAAGSAHPARSAGAARADRRRPVRGGHVRLHRGEGRRAVRRRRRQPTPIAHRQSAVGEVRHAASVAAARPGRRRRAQPAARPARRAAVRDRHAVLAPTGETRGVALAWTGAGDAEHWSGGGARGRLLRRQGRRRAAVRRARRRRSGSSRRDEPFLVAGQTAAIVVADGRTRRAVGVVGQIAPAVADARGLPRQDRVFVAELNLDRAGSARASTRATRRGRCRAIRSSSAICRSSSPTPCLRKSFVAPFRRPAATCRRRSSASAFFDRYQGKGVPDGAVSLSVRLTFQAPDRTLTDAEVQQSVDTILAALVARARARCSDRRSAIGED